MTLSKSQVKIHEAKAQRIMGKWADLDWRQKSRSKALAYVKSLGKLPNFYYNIFEDANYHDLNETLIENNKFGSKTPHIQGNEDYNTYKKFGGKTWEN